MGTSAQHTAQGSEARRIGMSRWKDDARSTVVERSSVNFERDLLEKGRSAVVDVVGVGERQGWLEIKVWCWRREDRWMLFEVWTGTDLISYYVDV